MPETCEKVLKNLPGEKVLEILSNVFGSRFDDLLEEDDLRSELEDLGMLEEEEEVTECVRCGCELHDSDAYEVEGEPCCEDCWKEYHEEDKDEEEEEE